MISVTGIRGCLAPGPGGLVGLEPTEFNLFSVKMCIGMVIMTRSLALMILCFFLTEFYHRSSGNLDQEVRQRRHSVRALADGLPGRRGRRRPNLCGAVQVWSLSNFQVSLLMT